MGVDELNPDINDIDNDGAAELLKNVDAQSNDITNLGLLDTAEIYTPSADWDYLLFEDSGTYKAVDDTGLIDSGTDFSTVAQAMMDAIPDQSNRGMYRNRNVKIDISSADLAATVTAPGSITLDVNGYFNVQDGSGAGFLNMTSGDMRRVWVDAFGATFHGGNATNPAGAFNMQNVTVGGIEGARIDAMGAGVAAGNQMRVGFLDISSCDGDGVVHNGADGWTYHCDIGQGNRFGWRAEGGGHRIHNVNCYLNNETGFRQINAGENIFTACHADGHDGIGFFSDQDRCIYIGCVARNNGQDTALSDGKRSGFRNYGNRCAYIGCSSHDDQSTATQQYGFANNGDYNRFVGNGSQGNSVSAYQNALSANSVSAANIPTLN